MIRPVLKLVSEWISNRGRTIGAIIIIGSPIIHPVLKLVSEWISKRDLTICTIIRIGSPMIRSRFEVSI